MLLVLQPVTTTPKESSGPAAANVANVTPAQSEPVEKDVSRYSPWWLGRLVGYLPSSKLRRPDRGRQVNCKPGRDIKVIVITGLQSVQNDV